VATKKITKASPPEPERVVFETYRRPSAFSLDHFRQAVPGCANGEVSVRRWRVTVEPIEEPVEVLYARLLDLWERCDNHHHWGPLKAEARKLGCMLPAERMSVRRGEKP
jgi:hypothetical protein